MNTRLDQPGSPLPAYSAVPSSTAAKLTEIRFSAESLQPFADWLDEQLRLLDGKFASFHTVNSLRFASNR